MSSALAMILMAAMAVMGSGPERVSGEMEQGLDLRGRWESAELNSWKVALEDGKLEYYCKGKLEFRGDCPVVDEGDGHFKMTYFSQSYLGIYRQEGGRLVICYRAAYRGRPVEYKEDIWNTLLTLYRVKPGK